MLLRILKKATGSANQQAAVDALPYVTLGLRVGDPERSLRHAVLAVGNLGDPRCVLTSPPFLSPQPRPLPPQTLVELLKHPFCVGELRRPVLDALALTYRRPFTDQWEFVEYARKHHPQLDLLTPPKRAAP